MVYPLVYQPLVLPSEDGNLLIVVPIKCTGIAAQAEVVLNIYEGSTLPTPGQLLASYTQNVSFDVGELKEVTFTHTPIPTENPKRDAEVIVNVGGAPVAANGFQDLYTVGAAGFDFTQMMGPMMAMMMLGMVMPMMTGMMEEEAPTEGVEAAETQGF